MCTVKRNLDESNVEDSTKKTKTCLLSKEELLKQINYYMSEENLKKDRFFNDKLSSTFEDNKSKLPVELILNCNKIKKSNVTVEDIRNCLESDNFVTIDKADNLVRLGSIPEISSNSSVSQFKQISDFKKKEIHAGGTVLSVTNLPGDIEWQTVRDEIFKFIRENVEEVAGETDVNKVINFVSEIDLANNCIILVLKPFKNHIQFVEDVLCAENKIIIKETALSIKLLFHGELNNALTKLPPVVFSRRSKLARDELKALNRPIVLEGQRYTNISVVRKRLKEIISSRPVDTQLSENSADYKLVLSVLKYHPRSDEKLSNMTGLKIGLAAKGESKCFHIMKGESSEDISVLKCVNEIEKNPPYAE